ncbi:MAG TPA: AmmeMemoRadiSam system protein B [Salinivirgaceae bacterium]|nr:AmmeMemoRadiSam system protein B [Salinivirgaceae bacterium]
MSNIRVPMVSGRFYPNSRAALEEMFSEFEQTHKKQLITNGENIIGGIVPHAGYIYSGKHAATFFSEIKENLYDTAVILSPSHTGVGPVISIDSHAGWQTPIGVLEADSEFIESNIFVKDSSAQEFEHAAEVIVPFIQHFCPKIPNVAVITMRKQCFETAKTVANGLKQFTEISNKNILVIASSDFNHFDSAEVGRRKDENVIQKILSFDIEGVEKEVKKHRVSVCGYGPIMALMLYAQEVSEKAECKILSRGHSGEVAKSDSVVDYVSAAFFKA